MFRFCHHSLYCATHITLIKLPLSLMAVSASIGYRATRHVKGTTLIKVLAAKRIENGRLSNYSVSFLYFSTSYTLSPDSNLKEQRGLFNDIFSEITSDQKSIMTMFHEYFSCFLAVAGRLMPNAAICLLKMCFLVFQLVLVTQLSFHHLDPCTYYENKKQENS